MIDYCIIIMNPKLNTKSRIVLIRYSIIFLTFLITACDQVNSTSGSDSEDVNSDSQTSEWLIPPNEVVDGGPGKDGIPSIDNPKFAPVSEIEFIQDDRLIIGLKVGETIKAYPHQVLDWHEIVNDQIEDEYIAMTYCPLTGTGITWNRQLEDGIVEFGVSGLLFRNNLIAYDRKTDSYWSQMQLRAVKGPLKGNHLHQSVRMVETTWKQWKSMYPDSEVLTKQTGFARFYAGFAYGESYLNDENYLLFPVKNENERLPGKTKVHAILHERVTDQQQEVRVFTKSEMGEGIDVINEEYKGLNIVAAGSEEYDFVVSFHRELGDGTVLNFKPIQGQLPVVMTDEEGNKWNIFGEAVSGPRVGQNLQPTNSYNGYWFAVADMFPNACVYPSTGCKGYIDK